MRPSTVLLLFALLPWPTFAAQKVSVDELRQMLPSLHGKSDKKIASRIAEVELTERLSQGEFDAMSMSLPGQRSRTALLAVADASVFRDPPARQMLPDASPDARAQREILMRAVQFANEQAYKLPNFVALRKTAHFQDVKVFPYSNKIEYYTPGSFRLLDHETDDVRCSAGGDEVMEEPDRDLDKRASRQTQPLFYMTPWGYHTVWGNLTWDIPNLAPAGLRPTGAFGPWLQAITGDLPDARFDWAYWEGASSDRLAVFRFFIGAESSHYTIEYDLEPNRDNPFVSHADRKFIGTPGYHGEIAVSPVTGQVARIVVICDLEPGEALSGASIELEYGRVEMDGETYVLPVRGVSASSLSIETHHYLFDRSASIGEQSDHFPVRSLDDLTFSDYRIYKSRIRIVPLKSLEAPRVK
jgi:hypothetical protein